MARLLNMPQTISIDLFQLQYRIRGETNWMTLKPRVDDATENVYIAEHPLDDLQPERHYEARLKSKNDHGWSDPSNIHSFKGGEF